MINIANRYSIFNRIEAGQTELPDLQATVARWHPQRIRRIDRYTQLCLAGGLSCVAGRKLPKDTGLYLATRYGAVSTSANVINTIAQKGHLPKPVHFVNSLGNTAGFYLTQLLQITGNTLVIAQEEFSFEAALLHACLDINSGRVTTALVGGVDEVALPLAKQLERLGLAANTPALHEGSHWLLLEQSAQSTKVSQTLTMPEYLADITALKTWLQTQINMPVQLSFTPNAAEQTILKPYDWQEFSSNVPIQGVYAGAALTHNNEHKIHLNRNNLGQYCAFVIE